MRRAKFTSLLKSERKLQSTQPLLMPPPKHGHLFTAPTYFYLSQDICFYFNLPPIVIPSQWSVNSDPRVAVGKRFDCICLSEERDIFSWNSREQTGNGTQTDHRTEVRSNISLILSLPPQSVSLLSSLMVLNALQEASDIGERTYLHVLTYCTALWQMGRSLRNFAVVDICRA